MIRWLKQLWCAHRGHPYPTITVPIVGEKPWMPETDVDYCMGCGAAVGNASPSPSTLSEDRNG